MPHTKCSHDFISFKNFRLHDTLHSIQDPVADQGEDPPGPDEQPKCLLEITILGTYL